MALDSRSPARTAFALLLGPTLAACASAPPTSDPIDVTPTAGTAAAAPPSAVPRAATVPAPQHPGARNALAERIEVGQPSEFACAYAAADAPIRAELAAREGGRPFVELAGRGAIVVRVGLDAATLAADVEVDGVFLRGFTTSAEVPLYAQRPIVFGGIVTPFAATPIRIVRAKSGEMNVAVGPFDDVQGNLERASACADVGLTQASYESAPDDASKRFGRLRAATVPIAATPDGAAEVRIVPGAREVQILGTQADRVRIRWFGDHVIASGWIAKTDVDLDVEPTDLFGAGGLGLSGVGAGGLPRVHVCPSDVSLSAEVEGAIRVVGYVRRETPLLMQSERRGALVSISLPESAIQVAEGALLLVDEARLASCATR